MSVFEDDLAAIHAGILAVDAVYTPDGGAPVAVRVIRRRPDDVQSFGRSRVWSETLVISVPVADVTYPDAGDCFTIGADVYQVQGSPTRDANRLRWTVELAPHAV